MTRVSTPVIPVKLQCTFITETAKAVLVSISGNKHWFPLSQVVSMHKAPPDVEVMEGTDCELIVVKEWIAKEKGLV